MGLYDNYRLSNSNQIPQFAGSVLPELEKAQTKLDAGYDYAKGLTEKTGYMNDNVPVLPSKADQAYYKQVHDESAQAIDAVVKSGRYEMMIPQVEKLAQETARKLKPLNDRMAGKQAEYKRIDDSNWSSEQKDRLKMKSADDDERYGKGIYKDSITGQMIGSYQSGKELAKAVDLTEWMDKKVKEIVSQKGGGEVTKSNGTYFVKNGSHSEVRLPQRILDVAKAAFNIDPEVQAYVGQQAELAGWQRGKNAKDTYKLLSQPVMGKDGQEMPNTMKVEVDKHLAAGISLREAIERVFADGETDRIKSNMFGYGVEKYKQNDRTTVHDESVDSYGVQRAGWAHDAKTSKTGQGGITIPSTVEPINPKETLNDLETRIKTTDLEIDAARTLASDWVKLDTDGQPLIKDGKYVPVEGKQLENVPSNVNAAINILDTKVADNKEYRRRFASIHNEAARANGAKDMAEAINIKNNALSVAIKEASKNVYYDVQGKSTITREELEKQLKAGNATPVVSAVGEVTGINYDIGNGKTGYVDLSSWTDNNREIGRKINAANNALDRIKTEAKNNYQTFARNSGTVTPSASLDKTPAGKLLNDNIVSTLRDKKAALTWTTEEGVTLSKDEIASLNLDPAKTEASQAKKVGNSIVQSVSVKDSEGNSKTYNVTFPATSNISSRYFELSKGSTDPGIQEFAMSVDPASQNQAILNLPPNGRLVLNGTKNMVIERSNNGSNSSFSIGLLQENGTIKYLTDAKGMKFYTSSAITAELEASRHIK